MDCSWAKVLVQPPEGHVAHVAAGRGLLGCAVKQQFLILIGEEGSGLGERNRR